MDDEGSFREKQPLAWLFHRNTSRWSHNATAAAIELMPQAPKECVGAPYFPLPTPRVPSGEFAELLQKRCSCRRFERTPLTQQQIADLLHATYGVLNRTRLGSVEFLERPVPSGGSLYPLEVYLLVQNVDALAAGIYHYAVIANGLERLREVDLPRFLREYLFMGQADLADAAVVVVLAAVPGRSLLKYGDRGYRYILLEAGHASQNLNLAVTAMGLGACNIGGFFDQELGDLLLLDRDKEVVVYATAVGHAQEQSKAAQRGFKVE